MDRVGGGRVGGGGGWKENVKEEEVGNTGFCFSSYKLPCTILQGHYVTIRCSTYGTGKYFKISHHTSPIKIK